MLAQQITSPGNGPIREAPCAEWDQVLDRITLDLHTGPIYEALRTVLGPIVVRIKYHPDAGPILHIVQDLN